MRHLMDLVEAIEFQNELENAITVDVSAKDIDGIDGILIHIEGPTSETDNHVTRLEAEMIFQELEKALGRNDNGGA